MNRTEVGARLHQVIKTALADRQVHALNELGTPSEPLRPARYVIEAVLDALAGYELLGQVVLVAPDVRHGDAVPLLEVVGEALRMEAGGVQRSASYAEPGKTSAERVNLWAYRDEVLEATRVHRDAARHLAHDASTFLQTQPEFTQVSTPRPPERADTEAVDPELDDDRSATGLPGVRRLVEHVTGEDPGPLTISGPPTEHQRELFTQLQRATDAPPYAPRQGDVIAMDSVSDTFQQAVSRIAVDAGTCPKCRHAFHLRPCLNMASDGDCACEGSTPARERELATLVNALIGADDDELDAIERRRRPRHAR